MKVLLIGATGVIGSQIVPFLKAEFELHLAAMSANAAGPDAPVASEVEGLAVEHCDIRDFPSLCKYLEGRGFDAVINCAIAPYNGVDYSDGESLHEYSYACLDINGRGAYNVLEAAWRARVGKVVYISSLTAVLGQPEYAFIERDAPERPNSLYAASKVLGEHAGRFFAFRRDAQHPDFAMSVLCLRLGMPFPSRSQTDSCWHLDKRTRSLMAHVEDIAQAVALALQSTEVRYDVFPVTSRSDVLYVDISKTADLGYRPRWTFESDGTKHRQ